MYSKEMFKETFSELRTSEDTFSEIMKMTVKRKKSHLNKTPKTFIPAFRKPAIISIAIVFCLLFAVPALAVNIPATYNLMYHISPSIAQFYKPVQKSHENNGVRMEVISAYIHGDTAEIYISMQDLTGNRIDATTDLFDSYSIRRPFNSSATCQRLGFDEASNTTTFLISITEWGNRNITGDKITFSVREFLSGKQVYDMIPLPIIGDMLLSVPNTINTMLMPTANGYGGSYDFQNHGTPTVLTPSLSIDFGVEGIEVTGMGYVDGMLHIQTAVGDYLTSDNHGYFYFRDKDGNEVNCIYSVSYNVYENGERVRYNEMVFNIPLSELADYEVYGYFVAGGTITDGPWQVTFPLG